MSSNFTVTRNQIILAVLRKLGQIEPGDTIDTVDPTIIENASFNLNILIKYMMTKGIKLWTIQELEIPLVANQEEYTVQEGGTSPLIDSPKPIKVIQAFLRNTSVNPMIDTPINLISRQQYKLLSSKFNTGTPNSLYVDEQQDFTNLFVWPMPDQNTEDNYILIIDEQQPIADINDNTDVINFPNEWYNTLVWVLADDIAIEFEVPQNHRQEISMKAGMYKDELEAWDVEYTSTYFQVNNQQNLERLR